MSEQEKPEIGSITWIDLTVPNAKEVKDFYSKVIGWKSNPVSMGNYNDFSMIAPESGKVASGICHTKGVNAISYASGVYITVANVDESAKICKNNGGEIIVEPKNMGNYGRYCVIKDPAGAVCALFKPE